MALVDEDPPSRRPRACRQPQQVGDQWGGGQGWFLHAMHGLGAFQADKGGCGALAHETQLLMAGSGLLPLIGNKAHAPRGYVQAPPLATPPPPRSTWQHHTSQAQPARPPTM